MSARRRGVSLAAVQQRNERTSRRDARENQAWRASRLERLPRWWSRHVEREHERRGGLASADANRWLLDATEGARGKLALGMSDDDLRRMAAAMARDCAALSGRRSGRIEDVPHIYARLAAVARDYGVEPPPTGDWPACARLMCSQWWLRALRRALGRKCEGAAVRAGVVRRGLWPYVSQDGVERRAGQRRRAAASIEGAALVDLESAEEVSLQAAVESSVANPANRRSEMMVRIRGADELAEIDAHAVEFWTLTAPSRYHAQRVTGATAEANPRYCGAAPGEAQAYLRGVWARARAAWKRRALDVYGLRTAEPHHDGCPHWHIVIYGPARDVRYARRLLRVYALQADGDEPGARAARFRAMPLRGGQAGASYAAKYIAKNIDGAHLETERDSETGRKIPESARRVDAWKGVWGIRQFQFFGLPCVTIWRILRKLKDAVAGDKTPLERARRAADDGDWCGYCRAMRAGSIRLLREASNRLTRYGDKAADAIIGLADGGRRAWLDKKRWVLVWGRAAKKAALERAKAHSRASWMNTGLGFVVPWSGVNNCTP
jgi:hypothetical protein